MPKSTYLLAFGMFILGLDAFVVAGLLPSIALAYNIDLAAAGLSVAAFTLSFAIAAPILATALSGRSSRLVLGLAMCTFALANAVSAWAPGFETFVISRVVAGMGAGLYAPFAGAVATMFVDADRKGRALSLILGGMCLGTVIGVPAGLQLSVWMDWRATFWLIFVISCMAVVGIALVLPSVTPPTPPSLSKRFSLLIDRRVLLTISITLLISIASLGLYTYVAALLESADLSAHTMVYLWVWSVGGVIGAFSIGHVVDWQNGSRMVIACVGFSLTIVLALLPFGLSTGIFGLALFFLWGLLGWSTQAPQQHTLLRLFPSTGAAAVALNSSANYLGSALGAFLGSLILARGHSPLQLPIAASLTIALGSLLAFAAWWAEVKQMNKD